MRKKLKGTIIMSDNPRCLYENSCQSIMMELINTLRASVLKRFEISLDELWKKYITV